MPRHTSSSAAQSKKSGPRKGKKGNTSRTPKGVTDVHFATSSSSPSSQKISPSDRASDVGTESPVRVDSVRDSERGRGTSGATETKKNGKSSKLPSSQGYDFMKPQRHSDKNSKILQSTEKHRGDFGAGHGKSGALPAKRHLGGPARRNADNGVSNSSSHLMGGPSELSDDNDIIETRETTKRMKNRAAVNRCRRKQQERLERLAAEKKALEEENESIRETFRLLESLGVLDTA